MRGRIALLAGIFFSAIGPVRAEPATAVGVLIGGGSLSDARRKELARELGVRFFRPYQLSLDTWKKKEADAEAFRDAGLTLILTVRNSGKPGALPVASHPPKSFMVYEEQINEVLDRYQPALLAVEDEENSILSYTGSTADYEKQLTAACAAAHWKKLKCTNGGLRASLVTALVWDHYLKNGEKEKAESYLQRACTGPQRRVLTGGSSKRSVQKALAKGRALLAAYKTSGVDYVNFHWVMPDADAFEETVTFLQEAVGKPVVTNEIGMLRPTPEAVGALTDRAIRLKMPFLVWASIDQRETSALHDRKGRWTPAGLAIKDRLQNPPE